MDDDLALRENRLRLLNRLLAVFSPWRPTSARWPRGAKQPMDEFIAYRKLHQWLPTIHVISDSVGRDPASRRGPCGRSQFSVTNNHRGAAEGAHVRGDQGFIDEAQGRSTSATPAMGACSYSTRSSTATSRANWPNTPAVAMTSWRSTS